MLFIKIFPPRLFALRLFAQDFSPKTCPRGIAVPALLSRRASASSNAFTPNKTTALPIREAAAIDGCKSGSAVAKAVRGAFPLRHIIGDHARGLHGRLAELGIAGDLALDALAFGMQQVAQAFEFGDQIFDFRQRG